MRVKRQDIRNDIQIPDSRARGSGNVIIWSLIFTIFLNEVNSAEKKLEVILIFSN